MATNRSFPYVQSNLYPGQQVQSLNSNQVVVKQESYGFISNEDRIKMLEFVKKYILDMHQVQKNPLLNESQKKYSIEKLERIALVVEYYLFMSNRKVKDYLGMEDVIYKINQIFEQIVHRMEITAIKRQNDMSVINKNTKRLRTAQPKQDNSKIIEISKCLVHCRRCCNVECASPLCKYKNVTKHITNSKCSGCKDYDSIDCRRIREILLHFDNCSDPSCDKCIPARLVDDDMTLLNLKSDKIQQIPLRGSCMLNMLRSNEVNDHINSCNDCGSTDTSRDLKKYFNELIKHFYNYPPNAAYADIFKEPVDVKKFNIPDYYKIITQPMDMGTVSRKFKENKYKSPEEIYRDVELCYTNCMSYNPEGTYYNQAARQLLSEFKQQYSVAKRKYENEKSNSFDSSKCGICNGSKLLFRPAIYFCNVCSQKIKKGVNYYADSENKVHLCKGCYNKFNEEFKVGDKKFHKSDFTERKNEDVVEESWVLCEFCNKWYHIICTLFNNRRNARDKDSLYCCPKCLLRLYNELNIPSPIDKTIPLDASALPKCHLSNILEEAINKRVFELRQIESKSRGVDISEIPECNQLTVRVVSSYDRISIPKPKIIEAIHDPSYPKQFKCHTKCIVLFQKIDHVDVILMVLYVEEYDDKCPEPNKRRAYISYLDSVKYFHPPQYRTKVYHELLVTYIRTIKERGFIGLHIWACPPGKNDDYILHCHPPEQKVPKDDRLKCWYESMLNRARELGIIVHRTNFHDEFLVPNYGRKMDDMKLSMLPYFDGDYWTMEIDSRMTKKEDNETKQETNEYSSRPKSYRKKTNKDDKSSRIQYENLFKELANKMANQKENHLYAHLQYWCHYCGKYILSGQRYECTLCKDVKDPKDPKHERYLEPWNICEECYMRRKSTGFREKGCKHQNGEHSLKRIDVNLPQEIVDDDKKMSSQVFDLRREFLSFCQGNHFQFDQLRRAKHSTMMVLYHLHNPISPLYPLTCNSCHKEICDVRYSCDRCDDFDLCKACYDSMQNGGIRKHPHDLREVSLEETEEPASKSIQEVNRIIEGIEHVSECTECEDHNEDHGQYDKIVEHMRSCVTRRCSECLKYMPFIKLHCNGCVNMECKVPKCLQQREIANNKNIKEHQARFRQTEIKKQERDERERSNSTDSTTTAINNNDKGGNRKGVKGKGIKGSIKGKGKGKAIQSKGKGKMNKFK